MEILLIRHGQSQADLEDRYEGRADFPLTELGHRQSPQEGEQDRIDHWRDYPRSCPFRPGANGLG